jgi:hypothetical protein
MKIGLGIGLGYSKESGGGVIPPAISSVTISGTAAVGQTLTATASGVTGIPAPTLSYQWKRGVANIGTNSSTYTLVQADAGNTSNITCVVTATNTAGSANATSNTIAQILDADAISFNGRVTTAGGTLSTTEINAINTLTIQMKLDNIWSSMKVIYPMVGASSAACAQNLKSASFTGTFTAGWTFASTGATPNGTSAFMNTTLVPSISLTNNNLSISVYSRTDGAFGTTEIGCSTSGFLPIIGLSARNVLDQILFDGYNFTGNRMASANTDGRGLFQGNITSSTLQKIFKNGVLQATNTTTQTQSQPTIQPLYISARNDAGFASNYSSRNLAFASIGDGLTDTQSSNLYTAVQAFQTTLNRQV